MRASNFALRVQPSLLDELRAVSDSEGVAVNQLINVAIAEKLAQLRTAQLFVSRIASADSKAGEKLIRDITRGGNSTPRKDDEVAPRKRIRLASPRKRSVA